MSYPSNKRKGSKYKNQKWTVAGKTFDSQREAKRYATLRLLQEAGVISDLKTQVRYELIPTQRSESGELLERACNYIADFTYCEKGNAIVEDCKGFKTEVYKIKKKLMLQRYGIRIRET